MTGLRGRFGVVVAGVAALLLGSVVAGPVSASGAPPAKAAFDSKPAAEVLQRILGGSRAAQVSLRAVPKGSGKDHFRVFTDHGRLVVEGTTPAVQLTGFGWYLRHVAHADVSINGSQLDLPDRLPLPKAPIARDSSVDHRFALNDPTRATPART